MLRFTLNCAHAQELRTYQEPSNHSSCRESQWKEQDAINHSAAWCSDCWPSIFSIMTLNCHLLVQKGFAIPCLNGGQFLSVGCFSFVHVCLTISSTTQFMCKYRCCAGLTSLFPFQEFLRGQTAELPFIKWFAERSVGLSLTRVADRVKTYPKVKRSDLKLGKTLHLKLFYSGMQHTVDEMWHSA